MKKSKQDSFLTSNLTDKQWNRKCVFDANNTDVAWYDRGVRLSPGARNNWPNDDDNNHIRLLYKEAAVRVFIDNMYAANAQEDDNTKL